MVGQHKWRSTWRDSLNCESSTMIKAIYATELEVVSDQGVLLLKLRLEEPNAIRMILNEDFICSLSEFEEIVPVIRHAFHFLGKELEHQ